MASAPTLPKDDHDGQSAAESRSSSGPALDTSERVLPELKNGNAKSFKTLVEEAKEAIMERDVDPKQIDWVDLRNAFANEPGFNPDMDSFPGEASLRDLEEGTSQSFSRQEVAVWIKRISDVLDRCWINWTAHSLYAHLLRHRHSSSKSTSSSSKKPVELAVIHERIADAITSAVLFRCNGDSMETAVQVLFSKESALFLSTLNLKSHQEMAAYDADGYYYVVHKAGCADKKRLGVFSNRFFRIITKRIPVWMLPVFNQLKLIGHPIQNHADVYSKAQKKAIELDQFRRRVCSGCQLDERAIKTRGDRNLALCGRCRSVWYCCKQCQLDHSDEHKKICAPSSPAGSPPASAAISASSASASASTSAAVTVPALELEGLQAVGKPFKIAKGSDGERGFTLLDAKTGEPISLEATQLMQQLRSLSCYEPCASTETSQLMGDVKVEAAEPGPSVGGVKLSGPPAPSTPMNVIINPERLSNEELEVGMMAITLADESSTAGSASSSSQSASSSLSSVSSPSASVSSSGSNLATHGLPQRDKWRPRKKTRRSAHVIIQLSEADVAMAEEKFRADAARAEEVCKELLKEEKKRKRRKNKKQKPLDTNSSEDTNMGNSTSATGRGGLVKDEDDSGNALADAVQSESDEDHEDHEDQGRSASEDDEVPVPSKQTKAPLPAAAASATLCIARIPSKYESPQARSVPQTKSERPTASRQQQQQQRREPAAPHSPSKPRQQQRPSLQPQSKQQQPKPNWFSAKPIVVGSPAPRAVVHAAATSAVPTPAAIASPAGSPAPRAVVHAAATSAAATPAATASPVGSPAPREVVHAAATSAAATPAATASPVGASPWNRLLVASRPTALSTDGASKPNASTSAPASSQSSSPSPRTQTPPNATDAASQPTRWIDASSAQSPSAQSPSAQPQVNQSVPPAAQRTNGSVQRDSNFGILQSSGKASTELLNYLSERRLGDRHKVLLLYDPEKSVPPGTTRLHAGTSTIESPSLDILALLARLEHVRELLLGAHWPTGHHANSNVTASPAMPDTGSRVQRSQAAAPMQHQPRSQSSAASRQQSVQSAPLAAVVPRQQPAPSATPPSRQQSAPSVPSVPSVPLQQPAPSAAPEPQQQSLPSVHHEQSAPATPVPRQQSVPSATAVPQPEATPHVQQVPPQPVPSEHKHVVEPMAVRTAVVTPLRLWSIRPQDPTKKTILWDVDLHQTAKGSTMITCYHCKRLALLVLGSLTKKVKVAYRREDNPTNKETIKGIKHACQECKRECYLLRQEDLPMRE